MEEGSQMACRSYPMFSGVRNEEVALSAPGGQ